MRLCTALIVSKLANKVRKCVLAHKFVELPGHFAPRTRGFNANQSGKVTMRWDKNSNRFVLEF